MRNFFFKCDCEKINQLIDIIIGVFFSLFLSLLGSPKIRIKTLKVCCLSFFITMHIVVGINFHVAYFFWLPLYLFAFVQYI